MSEKNRERTQQQTKKDTQRMLYPLITHTQRERERERDTDVHTHTTRTKRGRETHTYTDTYRHADTHTQTHTQGETGTHTTYIHRRDRDRRKCTQAYAYKHAHTPSPPPCGRPVGGAVSLSAAARSARTSAGPDMQSDQMMYDNRDDENRCYTKLSHSLRLTNTPMALIAIQDKMYHHSFRLFSVFCWSVSFGLLMLHVFSFSRAISMLPCETVKNYL